MQECIAMGWPEVVNTLIKAGFALALVGMFGFFMYKLISEGMKS